MRIELFGLALMALLILTACTPTMREDINYAIFKEQQRWNATDRQQEFRDWFDFDRIFGPYDSAEAKADREICLHPHKRYGVTRQDNVEDRVAYTQCAVAPENREEQGQRLKSRPRV